MSKAEYVDNVCMFDSKHEVAIAVSTKVLGQNQRVVLRRRMPADLHAQMVMWAEAEVRRASDV